MTEVVVVGGGIAGTTIAWELARRGTSVTLFEQGALAAGASGRNTGTLLHQTEPAVAAMFDASLASYRSNRLRVDAARGAAARPHSRRSCGSRRRRRAVIGGATAVTGDELRAAYPAFGPDVLGGQVLRRRGNGRAGAGDARVRRGGAVGGRACADRRARRVGARGRRAHRRRAGGRRRGRRRRRAVARGSRARAGEGGRGWLLQAERLDVPWIVEEVSWPDQVVLGRAAEPTPIADVAAGVLDVPVGECALLCPLPGGDGLLGASLSTSLRDAVEGVDVPAGSPRACSRWRRGCGRGSCARGGDCGR